MKLTLLITILIYIGTWGLVWGLPQIDSQYPGGAVWFTGTVTAGALLGCVITDIRYWWQRRK